MVLKSALNTMLRSMLARECSKDPIVGRKACLVRCVHNQNDNLSDTVRIVIWRRNEMVMLVGEC